MATDLLTQPQDDTPPRGPAHRARREHTPSLLRRFWWRALLVLIVLAALPVALLSTRTSNSAPEIAPDMKHTIKRGELVVSIIEQGTLESADNTEIKCNVRGANTVTWVIESGTIVQAGDELVRLDTLLIEEEISERTKFAHLAKSVAERCKADVARARLAVSEYEVGRYTSQLAALEKDLAIAESSLRTAQNMLDHAEMMSESGYVSDLDVEESQFAVTRAKLNVDVKKTEIDVLKRFTRREQLETLKGDLRAAQAKYEAEKERAYADELRRDRALKEFENCIIKAERAGLVIHPSAAEWKQAPEIEEGATVHQDQVLLLMPDLTRMQIKVGVHESVIDRLKTGQPARVKLTDDTIQGEVSLVSPVTRPAGWWSGNVVKYDTIVELPETEGLKPGMTAEVEIIIAQYTDVLSIPAAAVVHTDEGYLCWITTPDGPKRRELKLGDSNEMFIVVEAGLNEGDVVVLNPLAYIEEAQTAAAKTIVEKKPW